MVYYAFQHSKRLGSELELKHMKSYFSCSHLMRLSWLGNTSLKFWQSCSTQISVLSRKTFTTFGTTDDFDDDGDVFMVVVVVVVSGNLDEMSF